MTDQIFLGARILSADGWLDDHALIVRDGLITAVVAADQDVDGEHTALEGGVLVPGFIDTQVNGGGGILFNDQPNIEGIAAIAAAHRQFGTTGFLVTLISADLDVVAAAIAAVDAAIAQGVPSVIGIHIEGPFLNAGKHGIHDANKFRQIDAAAVALLSSLTHGTTLVTLAPELAGDGVIKALVEHGVIVAAGHSWATCEDTERARAEGLTGITHLFNAMTQMESRAPGIVGAALAGGYTSGLIVDGQHVHPASLRAAYAACGRERLMLVTDAMPTVGAASKSFELNEQNITARDGACYAPDGTLAGSDLDMAMAVRNAIAMMQVDLADAVHMASTTPAAFLGLSHERGSIAPGLRADLVHLSDAGEVQSVWIGGTRV